MKSIVLKSLTILLLFAITTLSAQDFQGKAFYQTKSTMEMDFASSGIPADRIKMIKERMKGQLEKTFVLTFNKSASIYKEEEKLDQMGGSGRGGMRMMMMMGGGASGNHYKNIQTKVSKKESEFSGKNFLISDELTTYEWKMEQETKMIGQNLCFKATTVVEMQARNTNIKFGRRGPENNEKEEEKEPEMEQVVVTAWYTLGIPVSHGPSDYWGLPGLILEIAYGNTNILCTKIVMNPKEKAALKEPKKGKVVSQEEYDKIIGAKMKEMRERFRNEREKGGNRGHGIRLHG